MTIQPYSFRPNTDLHHRKTWGSHRKATPVLASRFSNPLGRDASHPPLGLAFLDSSSLLPSDLRLLGSRDEKQQKRAQPRARPLFATRPFAGLFSGFHVRGDIVLSRGMSPDIKLHLDKLVIAETQMCQAYEYGDAAGIDCKRQVF